MPIGLLLLIVTKWRMRFVPRVPSLPRMYLPPHLPNDIYMDDKILTLYMDPVKLGTPCS